LGFPRKLAPNWDHYPLGFTTQAFPEYACSLGLPALAAPFTWLNLCFFLKFDLPPSVCISVMSFS
jgi:hypothetical protein